MQALHCSTKWYWKGPGKSLVAQSSTQSTLCKLCSTGRYFAQAFCSTSVKCEVSGVQYDARSEVKCGVWSVKCRVWS